MGTAPLFVPTNKTLVFIRNWNCNKTWESCFWLQTPINLWGFCSKKLAFVFPGEYLSCHHLAPNLAIWLLGSYHPFFVRIFPLWGSTLWSSLLLKPFHYLKLQKDSDDPDQPWARCDAKGRSASRSPRCGKVILSPGGGGAVVYSLQRAPPETSVRETALPSSESSWRALGVGGGG